MRDTTHTEETTMENMTAAQVETVKRLIFLGDSEALAIETVLSTVEHSDELYRFAYYS